MSEPRIGRVLVASLHQGIAETLPDRLEFYENWLTVEGLREGTIGLAPLHAVLSFLRAEGEPYHEATARAGRYAAEWTVNGLPGVERRLLLMLPHGLRSRGALRTVRTLVSATYPGSRAIVHVRKGQGSVDLRGSLFCEVREPSALPLCGYYAAAITRVLELFELAATTTVVECRSSGSKRGCRLAIAVDGNPGREGEPPQEESRADA
jgi:hypothetical protein